MSFFPRFLEVNLEGLCLGKTKPISGDFFSGQVLGSKIAQIEPAICKAPAPVWHQTHLTFHWTKLTVAILAAI